MLINARPLIVGLEKEINEIMRATFEIPPHDYASFMQVVGVVRTKLELVETLKAATRNQEEDEPR